jgi:hypothetical protein
MEYKPNTKVKNPTSEYSLVTVPRTGSHYLQDRIDIHKKHGWMIRSTNGMMSLPMADSSISKT